MSAWVVFNGLAIWPCPKVEGRKYVCSSHYWPLRWPSTNYERDGCCVAGIVIDAIKSGPSTQVQHVRNEVLCPGLVNQTRWLSGSYLIWIDSQTPRKLLIGRCINVKMHVLSSVLRHASPRTVRSFRQRVGVASRVTVLADGYPRRGSNRKIRGWKKGREVEKEGLGVEKKQLEVHKKRSGGWKKRILGGWKEKILRGWKKRI